MHICTTFTWTDHGFGVSGRARCNRTLRYPQFEETVLGEEHARRAASEAERTAIAVFATSGVRSFTLRYHHDNYRQAPCRKFKLNVFRG